MANSFLSNTLNIVNVEIIEWQKWVWFCLIEK